ncbi:MAG: hypothetical protein L6R36_008231 [Xanthoria steineri]|nr:MAG: hypothetical protein L6R36_008231 [Xanthoria steineri]
MDPASLSFAVVGMFLTCCKGYKFLSDTKNAPSDARDAARRVLMEFHVLGSWGAHFELRSDLPEQQNPEKLRFFLTNEHARRGVFDALCYISETFTDVKRLDKKYGIVCEYHMKGDKSPRMPRDLREFLDGVDFPPNRSHGAPAGADEETKQFLKTSKTRMSLLERCRWSVRDKGRIKELVTRLKRCNDDLHRLCHFDALAQINLALPAFVLSQYKNFMDLYKVAEIVDQSAQDQTSPTSEGRERLAAMAKFKARLTTPEKVADKYQARWRLLNQEDYEVRSRSHSYSMGASLKNRQPVFVEWQSFTGDDNRPSKAAEEQIHKLANFLSLPHRPHEFRGLDCVGLFKDTANDRYGVVYNLPAHLRDIPRSKKSESDRIYNPRTLTDLIRSNVQQVIDLGDRFSLAKKLIRSVVALHTCGWLHKNICPRNILFFAARSTPGQAIKASKIDFGRPFIVGYGLSRPDDIADREMGEHHREAEYSRREVEYGRREAKYNRLPDSPARESIYQHPDKATNPRRRFRHSYDMYSLGLVLLTIGLWEDLDIDSNMFEDLYKCRRYILHRLVPDLWSQCGAIYGEVVRDCLTISTDDTELAEQGQRNHALRLAEKLDRCVA